MILYASLQSSRGPRTISCDAQAAELVRVAALPCTREHRKINFHQKNTYDLEDVFFRVFAERSPTPYFYNEISPSRGPSFHNFDSKLAKLHFWPKRGQWDPMWSQFDSIWIKFHPNWVKLRPKWAQYIFTNFRSTAQADVMLFIFHIYSIVCRAARTTSKCCCKWVHSL